MRALYWILVLWVLAGYGPSLGFAQVPARSEGEWKEDKREGKWTYWHENGKKHSEGEYNAGKQEGKWTFLSSSRSSALKSFH